MKYNIPKEIRSKPKLFGLEMRELVIFLISFIFIFTVMKDLVHSAFTIPYFIVSGIALLWALMPSSNNPGVKNYMSAYLFFKHNSHTYHSIDSNKILNTLMYGDKEKEGGRIRNDQTRG
ncbi:DUF5592 family protein [Bacillus badius]|uniref:PrgI family protein n=1 Tax=Bacillus badius TaxID=1455 RepID=A0ABR5AQY4_BACBA|nr:DUF5592 family protein [Bacillus badius]KIL73858.1 hypothetical protein SD78_2916 [Bacillus badius]KIL77084.1 hypothetical protein SD77_1836 [Bacillus badius]KZO00926.1 hypothetical protein A4244_14525 [Bacillus badius]MED0668064.1 DUF5592 family protein [Bacillus badius]MED4717843.1 DUF5592 family protein [Bacillus badius]